MMTGLRSALVGLVLAALIGPAVAAADNPPTTTTQQPPPPPPPPQSSAPSAVAEYTETVPSSTGVKILTTHRARSHIRHVPAVLETRIQQSGGTDAGVLKEVVSSSRLGAPQAQLSRLRRPVDVRGGTNVVEASSSQGPASAFSAALGRGVIRALLVFAGLTAAIGLVVARRRAH
jgi:hypothetical protein